MSAHAFPSRKGALPLGTSLSPNRKGEQSFPPVCPCVHPQFRNHPSYCHLNLNITCTGEGHKPLKGPCLWNCPSSLLHGVRVNCWQSSWGCNVFSLRDVAAGAGPNAVVILPWYWKLLFLFFPMMTQAKQKSISLLVLVVVGEDLPQGAEYRLLGDSALSFLVSGTKLMCQYLQLSLVQRVTPSRVPYPLCCGRDEEEHCFARL